MTELRVEAHRLGWTAQTLRANGGKFQRDYFARGRVLVEVQYDPRGRIVEVSRRQQFASKVSTKCLGAADSGKRDQVLSWLQQPTTK